MSGVGKRSIGWVATGCCLVLVCSGCRFGQHWQGAKWRYWITQGPGPADWAECAADARQTGCPTDGDRASTCTSESIQPCGPSPCGCRLAGRLDCAGSGSGAEVGVAYYRHPRFHPVPLRPVFSSPFAAVPIAEPLVVPPDALQPIIQPGAIPPRIEVVPPAPVLEEILRPQPEPQPEDRLTSVPRRLPPRPDSRSWIFLPAAPSRQKQAAGPQHQIRR